MAGAAAAAALLARINQQLWQAAWDGNLATARAALDAGAHPDYCKRVRMRSARTRRLCCAGRNAARGARHMPRRGSLCAWGAVGRRVRACALL
jgi:hypothetical protein